jgi:hypothetical protein
VLGVGELTRKLDVSVHGVSASAREKIEAAGGTITLLREPKVKGKRGKAAKAQPQVEVEAAVVEAVADEAPADATEGEESA